MTANEGQEKIEILESETGYFQFRGCKVGNIRIHRKSETGYFRSDNSQIEGFEIANSTAEYFRIKENNKVGKFTIRNDSSADLFSIEKSEMCDFIFESGTIRLLTYNSSKINKFSLSGNNKFDIFISGGKINSLILRECILGLETSISISDTEIFYLQMVKFAVIGNLYLRNVKHLAEPVEFEKVGKEAGKKKIGVKKNDAKKEIEKKKPTFVLFHSSLGKTEFSNCELEGFILKYSNSDLLDTFIVGGSLPTSDIRVIKTVEEDSAPATKEGAEQFDPDSDFVEIDENDPQNPYQKASIFNQLKKVLERGGDTYRSSLLQSEWADNQLKHLGLIRKKKWENIVWCRRGKKYIDQTSQDIYSFWMNKKSNNHDENWGISLGWILVFSLIFYIIFLSVDGRLWTSEDIDWGLIGYYFEFLNPLHNTNFLDDKIKPGGGIIAIDVVAKLFMGFLIYKFLRAFRKYGKK